MRPKYLQVETSGRDRWMVSYMDLVTVLLIFFVAVAAKSLDLSKIEPSKVEPAKVEVAKTIPAEPPPIPVRTPIREKLQATGLDWHADPRGLVISLPQAVLFKPGRAQVNTAALPTVGLIAEILSKIPNQISLAGHADPIPIHNRRFKNNWELAAARSLELFNLLTTRYEIAESRLSIASYGSTAPRSPNDSAEGRANNRRVEIIILNESVPSQPTEQ